MSLEEEYRSAFEGLEAALKAAEELADYDAFLEKTLTELTHMTPKEIRRIYRAAQRPESPAQGVTA